MLSLVINQHQTLLKLRNTLYYFELKLRKNFQLLAKICIRNWKYTITELHSLLIMGSCSHKIREIKSLIICFRQANGIFIYQKMFCLGNINRNIMRRFKKLKFNSIFLVSWKWLFWNIIWTSENKNLYRQSALVLILVNA